MKEINDLFDKDEIFLLRKIGVELNDHRINLFKQSRKRKLIATYKIMNVKSIAIHKTNRRKFSWLAIFNIFNQDIMMVEDESGSQVYNLKITFKNGRIVLTDIEDFDLIRTAKLLEKLNIYFGTPPQE